MTWLKAVLGVVGSAYMTDAVARPRSIGRMAEAHCQATGKPLLLVRGERMVDWLFGDPVRADDVTRRAYPIPVPDKTYGAVVVVNTLERLKRPEVAVAEWRRVADKVFLVVPSWMSLPSWLDPGVKWFVPDRSRAVPLWSRAGTIRLLPVSDTRYSAPRCQTPKSNPQIPPPSAPPYPSSETMESPASSSLGSPSALMVVSTQRSSKD